jgi:chorismate mutase
MKYKLLLSLVIIFMISCFGAASLYAQEVPIIINYQSVIRDVSGKPAISNPITVTATLCADANCNTELWQEIFPTKTNQLGIVNIQLGKTVQIDQKFFNPIIYPKVYIRLRNDVGGTVLEEITEFSTVPYSVVSNKAIDMYIDELKDVNTQGSKSVGDVLSWNGNNWVVGTVNVNAMLPGAGIEIIGTTIFNVGDIDSTNDITITTPATGDLGGFYPSPTVKAIQGLPVSAIPPGVNMILKWNGSQWVPSIDENTQNIYLAGAGISILGNTIVNSGDLDPADDITNTTSATGDLAGIYPSPTVSGLQGRTVSGAAPALNQVLKWNGTSWAPAEDIDTDTNTDTNTEYDAGTGISIIGTTITNTGDLDPSNDITNTTTATGDLAGTYPSPTVSGLQGRTVSGATPALNQVLKWNGTS